MDLTNNDELFDQFCNEDVSFTKQERSQVLKDLYDEKKFYEILTLIPSLEESYGMPNGDRFILSLTLFHLGRVKAALRRLAIVIELEVDVDKKNQYLSYLVEILRYLKLTNTAPIIAEIEFNGGNLITCEKVIYVEKAVPIHQQMLKFLNAGGDVNRFFLGNICLKAYKSITEINKTKDCLRLLFHTILNFPSFYVFSNLDQNHVTNCLQKDTKVCHTLGTPRQTYIEMSEHPISCGLIVRHRFIEGFLAFLKQQYKESSRLFIWVISFITIVTRNFQTFQNQYFSGLAKRTALIYLCKSIELGSITVSPEMLKNILSKLSSGIGVHETSEFGENHLNEHFISMGIVLEKLAINKSKEYHVNDLELKSYDSVYIHEMLRKYILATVYKAEDDSTVLEMYDKILLGLLLFGGIHLLTVWFYESLKNYFMIKCETAPIHITSKDNYPAFSNDMTYVNCQEILNKIHTLGLQLTNEEKDHIWDLEGGDLVLLPNALVCGNTMILSTQFHNVDSFYFKESNFDIQDGNLVLKIKGQCKIPIPMLRHHYELSRELIDLWLNAYESLHGFIPECLNV